MGDGTSPSPSSSEDHVELTSDSGTGSAYHTVDELKPLSSKAPSPCPSEAGPVSASTALPLGGSASQQHRMSPLKRTASELNEKEPSLPSKRRKGAFNSAYMDLLNRDIEDAANRLVLEKKQPYEQRFRQSQVGLAIWTPLEKELLFEAVSRLGRDDLPGIASRIRTKNQMEVHQYIKLLDGTLHDMRDNSGHHRRDDIPDMADYPAAKELSHECCLALEEAAADLSLRIERHEKRTEEKKWGEHWLIDADLARRLGGNRGHDAEDRLEFARLFRCPVWLELAEDVFMNSADPENNWRSIQDGQGPSIRATAFEDFHSLAISLTRKLVISTLYIAQSRIKAKQTIHPNTRNVVKSSDVEAAVASLRLKPNTRRFWTTCARRLQLKVHDVDTASEEPDDGEIRDDSATDDLEAGRSSSPDDGSQRQEGSGDEEASGEDEGTEKEEDDEDLQVHEEAKELLVYSTHAVPQVKRSWEAVELRIKTERHHEAYAEAVDAAASFDEETEMWRVLKRPAPNPATRPAIPKRPPKATTGLRDILDYGDRWRDKLAYASEWETLGQPRLPSTET
ncbi:hypothetical protein SODALDRAFT_324114 [Sodiomyces alkalinus F11]|uniref:Myb-like domain-containing protein n=1 Tax=Sodiomyces alkalinus (strain CBS 110278 / VKM F-3762 / F11) TaxID=1314773 RepID=A0A3N2PW01_SODAK|nr:hypothetical protein SODALDRAFT_324114 [Sodiomyces alkalinus F11]ROT38683.1 hypothetical protein SODALDRAFT_324114 [Sodiomyces alkalinus F11]